MKLLVIGSTGRTGLLLGRQLLLRGHQVTAITRKPERLQAHPELTIIKGSPDSVRSEQLVQDFDAILSTLNVSRSTDFPWSPVITPRDIFIRSWENMLEQVSCKRVIVLSAWGAGETRKAIPGWFRWLIDNSNIGYPYRAHEEQESFLKNSDLFWTIIRPSGLTNGKKAKPLLVSTDDSEKINLTISRNDVATFMIDSLENDCFIQQSVNISSR